MEMTSYMETWTFYGPRRPEGYLINSKVKIRLELKKG